MLSISAKKFIGFMLHVQVNLINAPYSNKVYHKKCNVLYYFEVNAIFDAYASLIGALWGSV